MYTNKTLRISDNILEISPLETGTTSESINSGKISRLPKVIIQPVYGKIIPGQFESLISDIPAGDGNTAKLFLQCKVLTVLGV
jgi:hypothetical protein